MSQLSETPLRTERGDSKIPTQIAAPVRRVFKLLRVAALWEAFLVALGSLRANKLRTALTLMGIVVGVAAWLLTIYLGWMSLGRLSQLFR